VVDAGERDDQVPEETGVLSLDRIPVAEQRPLILLGAGNAELSGGLLHVLAHGAAADSIGPALGWQVEIRRRESREQCASAGRILRELTQ